MLAKDVTPQSAERRGVVAELGSIESLVDVSESRWPPEVVGKLVVTAARIARPRRLTVTDDADLPVCSQGLHELP